MSLRSLTRPLAAIGANLGIGALAGAAATAVMTLSSTVEMKIRRREPSQVPSSAAGKVMGVQPRNPAGAKRFGTLVHWSYGTAWGSVGGLMRLGLPEPVAAVAHFVSVWGTEVSMLPALDEAPPLTKWGSREVAIDVFHHVVYAAAFAGFWHLLELGNRKRRLGSVLDLFG